MWLNNVNEYCELNCQALSTITSMAMSGGQDMERVEVDGLQLENQISGSDTGDSI
jgi:hypothetical protein